MQDSKEFYNINYTNIKKTLKASNIAQKTGTIKN